MFIMICNIDDNYTLIVNIRIFVSRNCKTVLFSNSSLVGSVALRGKKTTAVKERSAPSPTSPKKNNGSKKLKNNCLERSVCGHLRRTRWVDGRPGGASSASKKGGREHQAVRRHGRLARGSYITSKYI